MRCTLKLSPHVLFCIPAEERFRFVASTTGKLRVLILVWILSRKIQEEKINETNLHYWPKYWLVLQPGNLVWSWQGSCLFLLTARTPLCTSPAMEAHNQSIGDTLNFFLYHFRVPLYWFKDIQWPHIKRGKYALTSLMVFWAWDTVTISWLVTMPE